MSFSDSMFLFEIFVEELQSYVKCKEFNVNAIFADVFDIALKDPNIRICRKKSNTKKNKVRYVQRLQKASTESNASNAMSVQSGQSVLFAINIDNLSTTMQQFPMKLTLSTGSNSEDRLGSTTIPWSSMFFDYLQNIKSLHRSVPVIARNSYDVFAENSSKRIANIKLNIKLTCLQNNTTASFRSLSLSSKKQSQNKIEKSRSMFLKDTGFNTSKYGLRKLKSNNKNEDDNTYREQNNETEMVLDVIKEYKPDRKNDNEELSRELNFKKSIASLVKSNTDLTRHQQFLSVNSSKSCSSLQSTQYNILNYIFGNPFMPVNEKVYCVGFFTVKKDSPKGSVKDEKTKTVENVEAKKYVVGAEVVSDFCKDVDCEFKRRPSIPPPPDPRILIKLPNKKELSRGDGKIQAIEEISGGVTAKLKFNESQCYCECECTFGFTKKTTYCGICGGYEKEGEDFPQEPPRNAPFPCPIYHKLNVNKKLKSVSDIKKKRKCSESAKGHKKDDRFKFNYGYTAPQIGHSQCAMPCTGSMGLVPKKMGWLWTADNVPGLKFRPAWKPGAVNKQVVHLLKVAKNPEIVSGKKRKKEVVKKPTKRPLLVVHKKDGEFKVTMETMRNYTKQRYLNQQPFEERPPVTYTVGRTDEENRERKKKKDRAHRRLQREQREFIQGAFRDMCKDICIKTYQQALGTLPYAEDPHCKCFPAEPEKEDVNTDISCSCSEDTRSLCSDTDDDEWIVEFTPPNATYDPTFRGKKTYFTDKTTQYTYLDYRIKTLDTCGNPTPRFFKGPDGKTQCSDLGGFRDPLGKWLEINIDGYIGPDGKWAPLEFIGPGGDRVNCEHGKFQLADGKWLVIGVDGYVDTNGVWKSYPVPKGTVPIHKKAGPATFIKLPGDKKEQKREYKPSEATWSCFGDISPQTLSKLGIVGHGHDKEILLSTLKEMIAAGADIQLPKRPTTGPSQRGKRHPKSSKAIDEMLSERSKCHHSVPSKKGVIAVNRDGNATYFQLRKHNSSRPKERLHELHEQGISLSSFHAPCFHSFINAQMKKQEVYEKHMSSKHGMTSGGR